MSNRPKYHNSARFADSLLNHVPRTRTEAGKGASSAEGPKSLADHSTNRLRTLSNRELKFDSFR